MGGMVGALVAMDGSAASATEAAWMMRNDINNPDEIIAFVKLTGSVFMAELYKLTGRLSRLLCRPTSCLEVSCGFRLLFHLVLAKHGGMYSPSLDEFLKLAAQGNLIPVTRRILADLETPLSAYRKISGQGESFLFESVEGGEHIGRYSFVGCNPRAVIKQTGGRVDVIENGKVVESFTIGRDALQRVQADRQVSPTVHDGLEVVERVMKKYR